MRKFHLLVSGFLLATSLFLPNILAQNSMESSLPAGAIDRLGKGWIQDIEFSPHSDQLAVATTIGIWIYDARTGKKQTLLSGIMGGAKAVSYSPGGLIIAAAHSDWTVRLWKVSSGDLIPPSTFRGHTAEIHAVEYSPDGKKIASGSADKTIRIWDAHAATDSKKLLEILPYKASVRTIAFSLDSRLLAGGSGDGTVQVWNADTGTRIHEFTEHTDSVQAVHFSRNRTELISASVDGTIILWSLVGEGGPLYPPIQHNAPIYAVKFSPDGNSFATGSANKLIQLWNTNTVEHDFNLIGHEDLVSDVDFSPDGDTLVSGSPDGTILLWDRIGKQRINIISGHTGGIKALVYTKDNRIQACGTGLDGKLRLWDAGTSSELSILTEHTGLTQAVAFSKNGKTVASGGNANGTIFLSDVFKVLENNADFSNDNLMKPLAGNIQGITALAFSPADTTVASGGADGRIYLLDTNSGRELKILRGAQSTITALTFAVDGTHLFSGEENGTLRQWNALTGEEVRPVHNISLGAITALSYSSANKCLAIGDATGTIQFFDLIKKRKKERKFRMPHPGVTALIFSDDGTMLLSGSGNGTIICWDMNESHQNTRVQDNTHLQNRTNRRTPIPQEDNLSQQTTQQIAKTALASTVLLTIQDANGKIQGSGSGFFVDHGQIATNYHVIKGATEIYAKLVGTEDWYAIESIVLTDEAHDLAVLKINSIARVSLPLANSDEVQIGEDVYAVGNPRGFEGTVSDGIVSGIRGEGNNKWIQITASISPGSSGGAVLNSKGEVIGIATLTYFAIDPKLKVNQAQNLNFAVPSNYLKALLHKVK